MLEGVEEEHWDVGGACIDAVEGRADNESSRGASSNGVQVSNSSADAESRGAHQYAPSLSHKYQRQWQGNQFWSRVYGLDMTAIASHAQAANHVTEPTVEVGSG